jgi:hypothetical protein
MVFYFVQISAKLQDNKLTCHPFQIRMNDAKFAALFLRNLHDKIICTSRRRGKSGKVPGNISIKSAVGVSEYCFLTRKNI